MSFTVLVEEDFLALNYTYLVVYTTLELLARFMKRGNTKAPEVLKRFEDKSYAIKSDDFIKISDEAKKNVEEFRRNRG